MSTHRLALSVLMCSCLTLCTARPVAATPALFTAATPAPRAAEPAADFEPPPAPLLVSADGGDADEEPAPAPLLVIADPPPPGPASPLPPLLGVPQAMPLALCTMWLAPMTPLLPGAPVLSLWMLRTLPIGSLGAALNRPELVMRPPPIAAPPPAPVADERRMLYGHRFLPSELVSAPFAATYFGTFTGFGYGQGSAQLAAETEATAPQMISVQQAAFTHGLAYQLGLVSGWALRASARLHVKSGLNQDTLAERGTDFQYGISLGTVLSLRIGRRLRIGAAADADYAPDYNVNLILPMRTLFNPAPKTAAELVAKIDQLQAQLFSQQSAITLTTRAMAAVALHPTAGLLFELRYAHPFLLAEGPRPLAYAGLGAALSIDLFPATRIPVGALLAYRVDLPAPMDSSIAAQSIVAHNVSGGLFYTGRPHLVLGIDVTARLDTDPQNAMQELNANGTLLLRYYW